MRIENRNLDFMRALAVLFVVAGHGLHFFGIDEAGPFHLGQLGALGVELFFVHTSLVLMMSLERQSPDNRFRTFMVRRVFRIYPLAIAAVVAVALTGIPQAGLSHGHFDGVIFDWTDLLANTMLVQSFSQRTQLLGPTWSLAYELQMYLLLPMIYAFISRGSMKRVAGLWLGSVAVAIASIHIIGASGHLGVFLPCFIPGIVAYHLMKRSSGVVPAFLWPVTLVAICAVYLGMGEWVGKSWMTCLLVGLAIPIFCEIKSVWVIEPAKVVAKYSYGIYLAHFAILWFSFQYLSRFSMITKVLVFATLMLTVPVALFRAIEQPMIRIGKQMSDAKSSVRPVLVSSQA